MWVLCEYVWDTVLEEFARGEIWYFDSLEKTEASQKAYDELLESGASVNMYVVISPLRVESKALRFRLNSGYILEDK